MFAILETGGKQYHVGIGKVIKTERIAGEQGSVIELGKVLAVTGKEPTADLSSAVVKAIILEHKKTDKVIVFKKKRRHNYRRKKGHRQNISVLRIEEIIA